MAVEEGKFIQAEGAVVPSVNPPEEKWDRIFSGSDRDYSNSVQQTSDSKYISLASQGLTVLAIIMMPKDSI